MNLGLVSLLRAVVVAVQVLPTMSPWPVRRQVKVESTAGGCDPAGDSDDLAAQARPSGLGQAGAETSGASMRRPWASVVQATSRTASTTWASVTVRAATTRPDLFQLR